MTEDNKWVCIHTETEFILKVQTAARSPTGGSNNILCVYEQAVFVLC